MISRRVLRRRYVSCWDEKHPSCAIVKKSSTCTFDWIPRKLSTVQNTSLISFNDFYARRNTFHVRVYESGLKIFLTQFQLEYTKNIKFFLHIITWMTYQRTQFNMLERTCSDRSRIRIMVLSDFTHTRVKYQQFKHVLQTYARGAKNLYFHEYKE
jgi:hypothetical protein